MSTRRLLPIAVLIAVLAAGAFTVAARATTGVKETLTDFKISGASSAPAGKVRFTVANPSGMKHELVVIRTKRKAAKLPMDGNRASEQGSVGEVEVDGGKTKRLTLKLKPGHYALICNIGNHYKLGMSKDFTVR